MTAYHDFLRNKVRLAEPQGFEVDPSVFNKMLKPHQRAIATWLVRQGRAACFAAFGLGKSFMQLEVVRVTRDLCGGFALITIPLGVRQEFYADAAKLGIKVKFIRRFDEVEDEQTIYLTNYETVRDGKLDPRLFSVASLDEASCLRGFGGSKTFREFMALFAGDDRANGIKGEGVRYRFVATATPSPNEYIELLAYAAFLGVMDVGQAKTRFFKRNSEKADQLTIHPHKEAEFWMWVSSWAIFVQRPSDLGFSDEGYELPALDIRWHEVPSDHSHAGNERNGQGRLLRNTAIGVQDAAAEKRESLSARITKLMEIRTEDPDAHRIIWHDLEAERHAIEAAIPTATSVYGSQDLDERERAIVQFSDGEFQELSAKPVIAGSGCNFQRHCAWAVYLGIGFKFNDFIQSVHRIQRFLQTRPVRIDLIYTEAERDIRRQLERKWAQHNTMVQKMTDIIKQYGLSTAAMAQTLTRSLGVERVEITGKNYRIVNNDCVEEARRLPDNSIHLTVTSIPFSTQYEYSPNYADFGHTDDNDHFFQQMDYLTPELFRATIPGRLACIHVKDRIVPGGMTGLGFQTVYPFHMQVVAHFIKHGWGYMGMKTIVTDVVRENAQTYRLSWTEQCKDGTKMGVGMPEYLLIFRKPPTDTSNAYGDLPVVKAKPLCIDENGQIVPFNMDKKLTITRDNGYSRARWQFDAHAFTRSNGNRPLTEADFEGIPHDVMFKLYREYSLANVYDFEHHVTIGEALEVSGKLPTGFMLLPPQSWHPDVWTDIARMRTLNAQQYSKGQEMHLCPLQFDIVDRAIIQYSMEGETIFDPFGGIMTVPYCAMKLKRKAIASELNPRYFLDGAGYCKAADEEQNMPGLFDLLEAEQAEQQEGAA
ncbi:DNA methyltransferase [Pseudomonas anguilliseptica]|uniref:DNA methyltransferase n=1 Tax=Pseudomonas anguilliseptica TaxID=53406 RepID=UPI0022AF4477|nr:DNA methyltransferase [Pseudomonas anguilliseptica]MCZ4321413.1 DNA methyltransferase [Pseudomonas anguilliseptica]